MPIQRPTYQNRDRNLPDVRCHNEMLLGAAQELQARIEFPIRRLGGHHSPLHSLSALTTEDHSFPIEAYQQRTKKLGGRILFLYIVEAHRFFRPLRPLNPRKAGRLECGQTTGDLWYPPDFQIFPMSRQR